MESCNHRYDRYKCVKCGKPLLNNKKLPKYELEKITNNIIDKFMDDLNSKYKTSMFRRF